MEKYIIINGTEAKLVDFESTEKAISYAENYCDHSKEIIVRKIENFKNVTP